MKETPIKFETISCQKQVSELVNLYHEIWENSFGIIDLLKAETLCFLMIDETDQRVIGYAFVEEDKERGFVELQDIAITKKIQNKGLGKKMMHFLMEKFPFIKLVASSQKKNLLHFYGSLGFKTEVVFENYYDIGADGMRMSWKREP